jgi:hypothetical protein
VTRTGTDVSTPTFGYLKPFLAFQLVLLVGTGITLTFLPNETDEYFAWTIKTPLTAAFLGVGYWTATLGVLLALLLRRWQDVRAVMITGVAFASWNLLPTLWYLDQFHFDAGGTIARIDAWAWLVFYLIDPPLFVAAIAHHELTGGRHEYAVSAPLLPWVRAVVVVWGAVLVFLGLALWPLGLEELWPWALPPLSAGVVTGWLLAIGAVLLWCGLRERDWRRVRIVFAMYIVFAALQLITAARFRSTFDAGMAQTWIYFGALAGSLLAFAAAAWRQTHLARNRRLGEGREASRPRG